MGEIENRPHDPSQMRISDADRQRVADVLRDAAGEGRIDLDELEERLELTWQAPETGPVASYVIAARGVDENFYRKRAIIAGGATRASVASSDLALNEGGPFYVSIAAVDARGHESLFAYPEFRCDTAGCTVPAGALDITATR